MTRRTISVALIVLGVLAVLAAIASATVWRPTDTATLSMPSHPDTPVVVSDPGVLDAVAPDVTIEARTGADEPVVLAVGRSADVEAWVGDAPHTRITGLASWEELKVATAEGGTQESASPTEGATAEPAEPEPLPNPAGSDLWVVEQTGTGSARVEWADRDGRWSLLAATDGTAPAPQVTLTWPVEVATPWLVPGLVVGGLLIIAGAALLVLDVLSAREMQRRRTAAGPVPSDEETAVLPVTAPAAAGLTRRELRERERAAARRRGRGRTGEIPVVTTTGEIPVTAPTRAVDDAGVARGAGIVPASHRAAELRAGREPAGQREAGTAGAQPADGAEPGAPAGAEPGAPAGAGTADGDTLAASGVSRGAAVVPASLRAAELRAERAPATEPDAARTEDEAGEGEAGAALAGEGEAGAALAGEGEAGADLAGEGEAGADLAGEGEATSVLPVVPAGPAGSPAESRPGSPAQSRPRPTAEDDAAEETEEPTAGSAADGGAPPQGWRSMWGFGHRDRAGRDRAQDRDEEGKEQR